MGIEEEVEVVREVGVDGERYALTICLNIRSANNISKEIGDEEIGICKSLRIHFGESGDRGVGVGIDGETPSSDSNLEHERGVEVEETEEWGVGVGEVDGEGTKVDTTLDDEGMEEVEVEGMLSMNSAGERYWRRWEREWDGEVGVEVEEVGVEGMKLYPADIG